MSNNLKFYLMTALYSLSYLMISGSVIQTFLIEYGVSNADVSVYTAATQATQVLVMLFASGLMDKLKNPLKAYYICTFLQIILHVALLFICNVTLPVKPAFIFIFIASILCFMFYGIHAILSYKIPYYIMDMNDYGKIMGKSGVMLGIAGSVFSALLTYFVSKFDYFSVMTVFFFLGIVMLALSAFLSMRFEVNDSFEVASDNQKEKINLFKYKPFLVLFIPDLMRGFNSGILLLATVVGYELEILDLKGATFITVLTQIATVIGCFVYSKISNPEREGKIIFFASVLTFVLMPLMVVGNSMFVFCFVYFAAKFVATFIDYGVPTIITRIVEYRCIGQYSAWRMLLHTAGIALGGVAVTGMIELFGGITTLALSALCQFISGSVYYIFSRKVVVIDE